MSDEKWVVAVDGNQLEGQHDISQVRQLMSQYAGKQLVVWNDSMPAWGDPKTLPQFRTPASTPLPRPAAPAAPAAPAPASAPWASAPTGPSVEAKVAARAQQMREAVQQDARFFKGLFDPSFDTMITPQIIRVLYILVLILVGLVVLVGFGYALKMIFNGQAVMGIVMLILIPIGAILQLVGARIFFELTIVFFKIKSYVQETAERGRS